MLIFSQMTYHVLFLSVIIFFPDDMSFFSEEQKEYEKLCHEVMFHREKLLVCVHTYFYESDVVQHWNIFTTLTPDIYWSMWLQASTFYSSSKSSSCRYLSRAKVKNKQKKCICWEEK